MGRVKTSKAAAETARRINQEVERDWSSQLELFSEAEVRPLTSGSGSHDPEGGPVLKRK